MLPDLRFIIGAVLAVALLGVTAFGLTAAVHLAHQSKVGPLESSRMLAYTPDSHRPGDRGPFANIPAVTLSAQPPAGADAGVQKLAQAAPEAVPDLPDLPALPAEGNKEAAAPADSDTVDERAVVDPPIQLDEDSSPTTAEPRTAPKPPARPVAPIEAKERPPAETKPVVAKPVETAPVVPVVTKPLEPPAAKATTVETTPVESSERAAPVVTTAVEPPEKAAPVARTPVVTTPEGPPEKAAPVVTMPIESSEKASPVVVTVEPAPERAASVVSAPLETTPAVPSPVAEKSELAETPAEPPSETAVTSKIDHVGSVTPATDPDVATRSPPASVPVPTQAGKQPELKPKAKRAAPRIAKPRIAKPRVIKTRASKPPAAKTRVAKTRVAKTRVTKTRVAKNGSKGRKKSGVVPPSASSGYTISINPNTFFAPPAARGSKNNNNNPLWSGN